MLWNHIAHTSQPSATEMNRAARTAGMASAAGYREEELRLRGLAERELDQRWARNTMLNKWLEYCTDRGHGFRA